ncbi:TPA: peptidoglycan-binding protein [Streptococcus suis]
MKLSKVLLASVASLSAVTFALPVGQSLVEGPAIVLAQEEAVTIRRHYGAAHGDRGFTAVTVLLKGDVLVDAIIEEFQFGDAGGAFTGVPNSDSDFGQNYAEGKVLFSKNENNEAYSAAMAEKAGSTVALVDNYKAIVEATKGKTADEILALADEVTALGEDGNVSDVVSGATLADTAGYLTVLADAIKEGAVFEGTSASDGVVLKQGLVAPHGTKSFGLVSVAVDGDKVVAAAIDEFQIGAADNFTGVPNSDAAFGEGLAEGQALFSKLVNNEAYSAAMAEKAGSTVTLLDNYKAVAAFSQGKTFEEIQAGIDEVTALGEDGNVSDVVSGATLADTSGYLQAILEVAQK